MQDYLLGQNTVIFLRILYRGKERSRVAVLYATNTRHVKDDVEFPFLEIYEVFKKLHTKQGGEESARTPPWHRGRASMSSSPIVRGSST